MSTRCVTRKTRIGRRRRKKPARVRNARDFWKRFRLADERACALRRVAHVGYSDFSVTRFDGVEFPESIVGLWRSGTELFRPTDYTRRARSRRRCFFLVFKRFAVRATDVSPTTTGVTGHFVAGPDRRRQSH